MADSPLMAPSIHLNSSKSPFKNLHSSSDPFSKSTPTLKKGSSRSPPRIEIHEDSSSDDDDGRGEDQDKAEKNGKVQVDGKMVKEMYRMMKTLKRK